MDVLWSSKINLSHGLVEDIGKEDIARECESISLVGIIPILAEKLRVQGEKSHHIWSVVMLSIFQIPLWESRTLQAQSEL